MQDQAAIWQRSIKDDRKLRTRSDSVAPKMFQSTRSLTPKRNKILHACIQDDWRLRTTATCSHLQPLAATRSHLQPLAPGSHLQPLAPTGECWEFSGAVHRRMFKILRCLPPENVENSPVFPALAATCSHLQPLGPSSQLQPLAATWSQQPLAATRSHLQPLAPGSHLQPLAPTGECWEFSSVSCTCSHLQPLAATCSYLQPLAATCSHLQPLAPSRHLQPLAPSSHLQPLAATCSQQPLAATCSHLLQGKWLQVAVFLKIKKTPPACSMRNAAFQSVLGLDQDEPYSSRIATFSCPCRSGQPSALGGISSNSAALPSASSIWHGKTGNEGQGNDKKQKKVLTCKPEMQHPWKNQWQTHAWIARYHDVVDHTCSHI